MKTGLRIWMVVGSMLVLLVAGAKIQAQVMSQQDALVPGYGVPYGPPMVAVPYGQVIPAHAYGTMMSPQAGAHVPVAPAGIARTQASATQPTFRVTTVGDETYTVQKEDKQPGQKATIFDDFGPKGGQHKYGAKDCGHAGICGCSPYAFRVYGEFLYLRSRDSEVCYAVETNSNLAPVGGQTSPSVPIQRSPIAVLDQDYSPGFRVGFGIGLDDASELGASYTWFDTSTSHEIARQNILHQIAPLVRHPATFDAGTGTVEAAGSHDLRLDVIDLDYRSYLVRDCMSTVDYVIGARWGRLEQNFAARFTNDLGTAPNESEAATDIDFSGAGLKLGLEAERFFCRVPLKVYAKGLTSLMVGEFDATYQQTVQFNSNFGVDTAWKAGRIVPTFDLEIGGGFYLPEGRLQATVGYVFSAWTNVVKTEDWIRAVQMNDFRDMGDTITFDGLVARVEGRF